MDMRNLGASGLRVSTVGIGLNNLGGRLGDAASQAVVHAAVDAGITLFDTADRYPMQNPGRSEELLGMALGRRRNEVVVTTKFGLPMDPAGTLKGASRRYIMSACEASLRRLKTDVIDLYQIHMPDPLTPIEETLRALDDLITQGKIRYAGCSNYAGWQIIDAMWTAKSLHFAPMVSVQDEYSVLRRDVEREVLPATAAAGMGFLPYFPLASGLLSGKYHGGAKPADARLTKSKELGATFLTGDFIAKADTLGDFAQARGKTSLELAFSWLLMHPAVTSVIAGASNAEQIAQNVAAASWKLTPEEMAEIDAIAPGPHKPGH